MAWLLPSGLSASSLKDFLVLLKHVYHDLRGEAAEVTREADFPVTGGEIKHSKLWISQTMEANTPASSNLNDLYLINNREFTQQDG